MQKQPSSPFLLPGPMMAAWRKTALHFAKKGSFKNSTQDNTSEGLQIPPDTRRQVQTLVKKNIKTIAGIWEIFNQDRQDLSKFLLTTEQASNAYLLGFHLPNTARAMAVLDRCLDRYPSLPQALCGPLHRDKDSAGKTKVFWTDFACGTGAMAQAGLYWLSTMAPGLKIQVDLVDVGTHLLKTAKFLLETQNPHAVIKTHKFSLETLRLPGSTTPADPDTSSLYGVSLGYIWNELHKNPKAKAKMGQLLQSYLSQNKRALVVLLEPATEFMARSSMQWRDQLTEWGYLPLYPCPQVKQCPMNPRPKDWCYSEFEWQQPPEAKLLDQLLGSGRHRLATAAYVFASPQLFQDIVPPNSAQRVVVGRPHVVQDQKPLHKSNLPPPFQYLLCSSQGLTYLQPKAQPKPQPKPQPNPQPKNPAPKSKLEIKTQVDPAPGKSHHEPQGFCLRGMLLP